MCSIWLCSVGCLREKTASVDLPVFLNRSEFHLNVVQSLAVAFSSVYFSSIAQQWDAVFFTAFSFSLPYWKNYSISPVLQCFFFPHQVIVCEDKLFQHLSHIWLTHWIFHHILQLCSLELFWFQLRVCLVWVLWSSCVVIAVLTCFRSHTARPVEVMSPPV